MDCPFCNLKPDQILFANDQAVAIRDAFPVAKGHTLIIPRRHFGSFFEASVQEQAALLELLAFARQQLVDEYGPDGFNIGINDGSAAGQTVPHLHIHLIPRYYGDQPDPRGGVRWIFPDQAAYWKQEQTNRTQE